MIFKMHASVVVRRKYTYLHPVKSFESVCSAVTDDQTDFTSLLLKSARNTRVGFKWKLFELNQPSKYF